MTHNGVQHEVISPGELLLYGHKFKLTGNGLVMQESLVSVFPGKIVQGDATRADDPLASSYVMSDLDWRPAQTEDGPGRLTSTGSG